jgi:hypothetical protein
MSLPHNGVVVVTVVVVVVAAAAAAAAALNSRSIQYFERTGNREVQKFTYRFLVSVCVPAIIRKPPNGFS